MSRQLMQTAALLCYVSVVPVPALLVNHHSNSQSSLENIPLSEQTWTRIQSTRHLLLHSHKHKLAFCMIPKNACSEFLALMMRVDGMSDEHYNPTMHGHPQSYLHFDEERNNLFFNHTFEDKYDFKEILNGNYGWKTAFFFRDPVERFVSSYLSKVTKGFYNNEKRPGEFSTNAYRNSRNETNISLAQVVSTLSTLSLANVDPHFRPQSFICGLNETLDRYDFVGSMDNLASDAKKMLNLVGNSSWAGDMLDSGWGPNGTQSLFGVTRKEREGDHGMVSVDAQSASKLDFNLERRSVAAAASLFNQNHLAEQRAVQREMASMDPSLRQRIRELYHMDYGLMRRAKELGLTTQ